jgi:hypothetical protein
MLVGHPGTWGTRTKKLVESFVWLGIISVLTPAYNHPPFTQTNNQAIPHSLQTRDKFKTFCIHNSLEFKISAN